MTFNGGLIILLLLTTLFIMANLNWWSIQMLPNLAGGALGEIKTWDHWSVEESYIHTNVLELIAAFNILTSLCRDVRNKHIKTYER